MADCLTTPEKQLWDPGESEPVEQTRSALHLNDQEFDPDLAVIVFVLAPASHAAA